jgi:GT2 family glycosyltransferase
MISKELFVKLGGYDEAYRNGVEDIDLCLRVRTAGYKVIYEPKAVLYHHEGQSAGRFDHVQQNLQLFFGRWRLQFDARGQFILPGSPAVITAGRRRHLTEARTSSQPKKQEA